MKPLRWEILSGEFRQIGTLANAVFIKETEESRMCVARSCKHAGKSAIWQNVVHIRYRVNDVLSGCRQVGKITWKACILQVCRQVSKISGKNLHIGIYRDIL